MNTTSRNAFLGVLGLIALVGVAVVILVTRPAASSGPAATGETKTVAYTAGGRAQTVALRRLSADPLEGARFVWGDAKAPVTVVEFSDYECPSCAVFATQTEPLFRTEFVETGKVRFAYRDFPLPFHAGAEPAAVAAACANDQGRYDAMKAVVFRAQSAWSSLSGDALSKALVDYAGQVGLDAGALEGCLKANTHVAAVRADRDRGNALGIKATPSFIVNGWLFEGALPIEGFRAVLAEFGAK